VYGKQPWNVLVAASIPLQVGTASVDLKKFNFEPAILSRTEEQRLQCPAAQLNV
jgi:hypothetical protein